MKLFNAFFAALLVGSAAFVRSDPGDQPLSNSLISVGMLSTSDADYTPEEELFIGRTLIWAFHKSHGNTNMIDLDDVKCQGQSHKPADKPPASAVDAGDLTSGMSTSGMSYYWDFSQYFPMWHCRNGWCPSALEAAVIANEMDVDASDTSNELGKKKKTPHEAWEKKLCKALKKSDYKAFNHVSECKITFEAAPTTVSKEEEDEALGSGKGFPLNDGIISATMLSKNNAEHSPKEQHFMEYALVSAFHSTHGKNEALDLSEAKFEGQSHPPAKPTVATGNLRAAGMSYYWDISQYFPMWYCRNGWCPSAADMEAFVSDIEIGTDLDKQKHKTPHQAWANTFCKILNGGPYEVFNGVSHCAITFQPAVASIAPPRDFVEDDEEESIAEAK